MATERTPKEGERVTVWSQTGEKVFEGTVADVLVRPVNGKTAKIVLTNDEDVSDAK